MIVYNRIDRGKLHRGGKKGCWMAKQRKFKQAMVYEDMPDPSMYTSRCKLCWQQHEPGQSSSDSEDEMVDGAEVFLPKAADLYRAGDSSADDIW